MSRERKVPRRRFREFVNEEGWDQCKLGDISDITKLAGFEFTEHVVYSEKGNIIALRGLNVKNGQLILDDVKYIDGSNFTKLSRSKLFVGDILFTYVGTVGEVAIIKENDKFYLAPNVSRIRIKSDDSPQYISHYMRNNNFYNSVIFPLIATSSQPALSMENIRLFNIKIPKSYEEQNRISEFFSSLDNIITFNQHKLEKLKALKNAYLTQMFPSVGECKPKLRFDGFNDEWEQRKLGDEVIEVVAGGDVDKGKIRNYGKYPVLANSLVNNGIVGYYNNYFRVKAPAVTVTGRGDVGHARARKVNFTPVVRLISIKSKHNVDFLEHAINNCNVINESTGVPQLTVPQLSNYNIYFPKTIDEEEAIGEFFYKLEDIIKSHQRKLEKLQNLKKAYLNEMFI